MATETLSYLARIDAEPDATKLKLVRGFMAQEPLNFFRELREQGRYWCCRSAPWSPCTTT